MDFIEELNAINYRHQISINCEKQVWKIQKTIYICGTIDKEIKRKFNFLSKKDFNNIVINSVGGNGNDSLSIGRIIYNKKNIKLILIDECTSSCSQVIMPAAKSVYVTKNTMVFFHHSANFAVDLIKVNNLKKITLEEKILANNELNYYNELGINKNLLYYPAYINQPFCYFKKNNGRDFTITFLSKYSLYVPSKDEINILYGDKIKGYWPKTPHESLNLFRKKYKVKTGIFYGVKQNIYLNVNMENLKGLKICSNKVYKRY
jgi:hypothetical protein